MKYAEFAPSPLLAPYVRCYWILEGAARPDPEIVLPDGRIELIIHYGDPFSLEIAPGQWRTQDRAFLAGQIGSAIRLVPSLRAGVCGVRFRYSGAAAFLDAPLGEFTNAFTPVQDFWGPSAAKLPGLLADAPSAPDRIARLEKFLAARLHPRPDPVTDFAVRAIASRPEAVSISALAAETGWSRRHLARRFEDRVGLPPKLFARILRFQAALRAGPLALQGYFDQSHFIRDCRQFTGCTPTDWKTARHEIMSHFSKTAAPGPG